MAGWRCLASALSLLLLVLRVSEAIDSEHEIRLAILLTRHGDRTPTKLFPNCKSQWPEGLGQMTALGLRQMFDLGTRLRERYVDRFGLISPSFHTDEVFVRSTSKDRTLMSAHAFMQGLFPKGTGPMLNSQTYAIPGGTQPIPIHAADTHQDHLLYAYKACPRLKLLKKAVHASPAYVQLEESNQELLHNMSVLFGAPLRLKDLTNIAVLLQQERTHNQPSVHLLPSTVAKLNTVTEELFGKKFPTREMGRLAGGNLLADIVRRMEKIAYPERFERFKKKPDPSDPTDIYKKEKGDPRFVYYSGHDGTILALFSAMGAHAFRGPQFASHVLLELHESKDGEFLVEMEYDGMDVQIPGCAEECPLDDFISLMEEGISDDWAAECNNLNVEVPLPKAPRAKQPEVPLTFFESVLTFLAPLAHTPLVLLLVTYGSGLATGLLFVLRAYSRDKRSSTATTPTK